LASDTSRRLGDYPPPAEAAVEAGFQGAFGGAIAGYLGGGPLEVGKLADGLLWVTAIAAGIGFACAIMTWFALGYRDWFVFLLMPAAAVCGAMMYGVGELFDWGVGWVAAQWGRGLIAAVVGAIAAATLGAGFTYLTACRRERRAHSIAETKG